jgi:DNA modification methylase
MNPILTAMQGTNADLLPKAFELYIKDGDVIADVTYGKGVFWKNIDKSKYTVLESDLNGSSSIDFRSLLQEDGSVDHVFFDPPYMHGGKTVKESINDCYRNDNNSHESVIRLYAGGILEAARILKKGGKIFVKCQDEIESGKQRWSHEEISVLLDMFGFVRLDMFVLVQNSIPAMRYDHQKSARKNHSYLIVAEFRR